jgi:hypothetical protein
MWLDVPSTTAFDPPPAVVICESSGRNGVGSTPNVRPRGVGLAKPNTSATTWSMKELALQFESQKSASILDRARTTIEISKRLQFLKIEAEIDRISFSEASLSDFQAFMREIPLHARPSLFLSDNGNLRALWKNQNEQVGLQFLGEGNIQFVIFKQRKGTLPMARIAGIDTKDKILGHIRASGAEGLLSG